MHRLRVAAQAVLPAILPERMSAAALAVGDRYAQYRRYRKSDSPAAIRTMEAQFGLKVRSGPFRGMIYPRPNAYSRHSIPKLLGCYEEELHPSIAKALSDATCRRFVDIGSAEGYYSVGFALAARRAVFAFEIDPFERRYTRLMARENQVESLLSLEGWCSPGKLCGLCPDRSFILCDCEGYETALFTTDVVRQLAHSDLIVELHAVNGGSTKDTIVDRFAGSHDVRLVTSRERRAADYAELAGLSLQEDRFVNEFRRRGQQWAVLTAREGDAF